MQHLPVITIGFSPCPNDTFIFDALVNRKIESPYQWEVHLADVEELNRMAFASTLTVTKLSFHTWLHLQNRYDLLESGSALGVGCGPLLIAKKEIDLNNPAIRIAIPGEMTTANFLFKSCYPHLKNNTVPLLFSAIEEAVLNGTVDAGVIIHENRFTYAAKGLHKIKDLGEWWETTTQAAIPLGGIVIKNTVAKAEQLVISNCIKQSTAYAFAHLPELAEYVKSHAQEMDEAVMRQHIDLYVNDYTLELGTRGHAAIQTMQDYFNRHR